jgi:hypothetical protein
MTIKADGGNVGINTTSPAQKLDVVGNTLIGPAGGKMFIGDVGHGTTYPALAHQDYATTTGYVLLVPNNGYVFLNKRDVANTYIGFRKANADLMVINNSGSVGIGTTAPAYLLDVSGTIRATGDVIAYSDARVKTNVKTLEKALEKINSLRGVSYTRTDSEDKSEKIGVIAQEVLEILPQVVQQDDSGNYSVAYGNMVGVLIEAVKELSARIEQLENK